jgi:hypothetical protein
LWRGFEQITSTRPFRRMILHFSHIGLTDGRTFTLAWLFLFDNSGVRFLRRGSGDRYGRRYLAEEHLQRSTRALQAHPGMLAAAFGGVGNAC